MNSVTWSNLSPEIYLNIMVQADLSSQVLQSLARVNQTMWELFTRDNSVWRGRLKTEMGIVLPFKSLPCRGYELYKTCAIPQIFLANFKQCRWTSELPFPVGRKPEEKITALKMWGDKYYIGSTTGEVRELDPATGKKRAVGCIEGHPIGNIQVCGEWILAGGGTTYPNFLPEPPVNGIKIWNLESGAEVFSWDEGWKCQIYVDHLFRQVKDQDRPGWSRIEAVNLRDFKVVEPPLLEGANISEHWEVKDGILGYQMGSRIYFTSLSEGRLPISWQVNNFWSFYRAYGHIYRYSVSEGGCQILNGKTGDVVYESMAGGRLEKLPRQKRAASALNTAVTVCAFEGAPHNLMRGIPHFSSDWASKYLPCGDTFGTCFARYSANEDAIEKFDFSSPCQSVCLLEDLEQNLILVMALEGETDLALVDQLESHFQKRLAAYAKKLGVEVLSQEALQALEVELYIELLFHAVHKNDLSWQESLIARLEERGPLVARELGRLICEESNQEPELGLKAFLNGGAWLTSRGRCLSELRKSLHES